MKIVCVQKGGLGNQLFIYFAGRAIGHRLGCVVQNECKLGFWSDFQHKRNFRLKKLLDNINEASVFQSLYYLILYMLHRLLCIFGLSSFTRYLGYVIISDKQFSTIENIMQHIDALKYPKLILITGYWQNANFLINELIQKDFEDVLNINTAYERRGSFLGVRLYEESHDPLSHVNGDLKVNICRLIELGRDSVGESTDLHLFSTVHSIELKRQFTVSDCNFHTPDIVCERDIDVISECKNFKNYFISASSLYFWVAYLATLNSPSVKVYYGGNLKVTGKLPQTWKAIEESET